VKKTLEEKEEQMRTLLEAKAEQIAQQKKDEIKIMINQTQQEKGVIIKELEANIE